MKRLFTALVPQPAAGADWSLTPSTSDRARIVSATAQLVTSATVADRVPALVWKDKNAVQTFAIDTVYAQAASLTATYNAALDVTYPQSAATVAAQQVAMALPNLWLEAGDTLSSLTTGIDAADQWSNIVVRYLVGDEWDWQREVAEVARDILAEHGA